MHCHVPRREKYDSDADSESSDDDTDTDMEYELDTDEARRLASSFRISEKAIMETYKKQRGVCRVTRIPFAQGLYAPTAAPRCIANPVSEGGGSGGGGQLGSPGL